MSIGPGMVGKEEEANDRRADAPSTPGLTFDTEPLIARRSSWTALFRLAISVAVLATAFVQLGHIDLVELRAVLPTQPIFWLFGILYFLSVPIADFVIFRRLLGIPPAGFAALIGKQVANEMLIGYSGELYFYAWAQRHARLTASPFGAVKDVAILSALAGNAVALLLLILAIPLIDPLISVLDSNVQLNNVWLSVGFLLATSFLIILFRTRVFSLPRRLLFWVATIHVARIALAITVIMAMWVVALPGVEWQWWVFLAIVRLLIGRMPFLPNKDLVFAAFAVLAIGQDDAISALLALMGGMVTALYILSAFGLALNELIKLRVKT